jgi:hypothetical protein
MQFTEGRYELVDRRKLLRLLFVRILSFCPPDVCRLYRVHLAFGVCNLPFLMGFAQLL